VEAFAQIGGDLVELVASVDFDGLTSGVEDDAAVLAAGGVLLNLGEESGTEVFVEVVRQMG
jgi:hypothetical protein